jgi:hypothetical protein
MSNIVIRDHPNYEWPWKLGELQSKHLLNTLTERIKNCIGNALYHASKDWSNLDNFQKWWSDNKNILGIRELSLIFSFNISSSSVSGV